MGELFNTSRRLQVPTPSPTLSTPEATPSQPDLRMCSSLVPPRKLSFPFQRVKVLNLTFLKRETPDKLDKLTMTRMKMMMMNNDQCAKPCTSEVFFISPNHY